MVASPLLSSPLQSLISEIEYYLYPPDWSISLSHVYRDANHSTDFLAKSGFSGSISISYLDKIC
jgi:hypothetical protein